MLLGKEFRQQSFDIRGGGVGLWFILGKKMFLEEKIDKLLKKKNVTFNKNTKKKVPGGKHVSIFEHRNS